MNEYVKDLKRRCRDAELELIEKPEGHYIVVGGLVTVHYWPMSRRLTAYAEGAPKGLHNITPKGVVNLATKGSVR